MIPFARVVKYGNRLPVPAGMKKIKSYGLGHMFLTTDGDFYVYGINSNGRFGTGSTDNVTGTPLKVMSGVADFAMCARCTVLIMNDGTFLACGALSMMGLGTSLTYIDISSIFLNVSGLTKLDFTRRDSVNYTLYALTSSGDVFGMGYGNRGQLGIGTGNSFGAFIKINENCSDFISTGYETIAVLKKDGTVWYCGNYQFNSVSTDTTVFTSIGATGVTKIWGTGLNGEMAYTTSAGLFVRGISGSRFGLEFTAANRGSNLRVTLPFAYNASTFNGWSDETSSLPSFWMTDGIKNYGTGSSSSSVRRMSYVLASNSGSGVGEQDMTNVPMPIKSVVAGNSYSAIIDENGVVYGSGPFDGFGSTTGESIINYPGNNPTLQFYDKIKLDISSN